MAGILNIVSGSVGFIPVSGLMITIAGTRSSVNFPGKEAITRVLFRPLSGYLPLWVKYCRS